MAHPRSRSSLRAGLLVVAVTAASCGSESTTSTTTTTTSTSAAPSAAETTTTDPRDDDLAVVEIELRGGDVVAGGGRVEIELGSAVELRVSSDADDELHLHGYDLEVAVVAGEVAFLRFDADLPGVFEAELHDSGTVVVELAIA